MSAELSCDTAPEQPRGLQGVRWKLRRGVATCVLPLMQRAGRSYVGGETMDDALSVIRRLAVEGTPSTLGLWDLAGDSLSFIAQENRDGITKLAESGLDSYLSIKPPALRFQPELAGELAAQAARQNVALHCDSHGPEVADASCTMLEWMERELSPALLSTTLPGRWQRSVRDARWAAERGYAVRVVKGQWADPADPKRDLRAGFLEVIDALAGHCRLVRVATHDIPLGTQAIERLRAAGTPCEWEVLFGMPIGPALAWARAHQVATRIYVPYGRGYLPHALAQLRRNPRFLWWMAKGLFARSKS